MGEFNIKAERKALLENLQYLKSLPVKEFTFRKKYDELKYRIETNRQAVHHAKGCIWCINDFEDKEFVKSKIQNLKPKIIIADSDELVRWWGIFRLFLSTAEYNNPRGRCIRFFVVDANDKVELENKDFLDEPWWHEVQKLGWPVIGIGAISSDLISLGDRDSVIGWSKAQKIKDGRLQNIAIGSTIVPTQPFGFNFNGGKLISALITAEILRNEWQLRYGDVLVGMTTTSLYGQDSMYNNWPWWDAVGKSKGAMTLSPSLDIYRKWLKYIKQDFEEFSERQLEEKGYQTKHKPTALKLIYKEAGIKEKDFTIGFERGMYFSEFYENTKEFLTGKIAEDELKLKSLFAGDVDRIMEAWRPQAYERYRIQQKKGKLKVRRHFYNHLGYMDYETAKEVFMDSLGR